MPVGCFQRLIHLKSGLKQKSSLSVKIGPRKPIALRKKFYKNFPGPGPWPPGLEPDFGTLPKWKSPCITKHLSGIAACSRWKNLNNLVNMSQKLLDQGKEILLCPLQSFLRIPAAVAGDTEIKANLGFRARRSGFDESAVFKSQSDDVDLWKIQIQHAAVF